MSIGACAEMVCGAVARESPSDTSLWRTFPRLSTTPRHRGVFRHHHCLRLLYSTCARKPQYTTSIRSADKHQQHLSVGSRQTRGSKVVQRAGGCDKDLWTSCQTALSSGPPSPLLPLYRHLDLFYLVLLSPELLLVQIYISHLL